MVTKLHTSPSPDAAARPAGARAASGRKSGPSAQAPAGAPLADAIRDSAQQIWQAGLGAFHRAQAEGGRAFDALVKEGVGLQRKTQSAAQDTIAETTRRMSSMATDLSSRASGQWDKLEGLFEDRVARALNKLGVPSAKDVQALMDRVEELNRNVQALSGQRTARKAAASTAPRTAARTAGKAAVKPAGQAAGAAATQAPARASSGAAVRAAPAAARSPAKKAARAPARKAPAKAAASPDVKA